jgi:class 3 adenylate cyclase/pimeloyl-ACP methyl ester carboxylesterase
VKPDVLYARNGDAALAYQVVGSGARDLLLVFGYVSNLEYAWEYPSLSRFLTELASSSRLILMDRRGAGLSDRFGTAPSQEVLLSDIVAVLDEVGSARATLLGIWDGALTSVLFAGTYPDRVASMVLFSASAAQLRDDDYPWAWSQDMWDEWLASIRDGWGTRAWVVRNARWMSPSLLEDPTELEHWISYTRLSASPSSAEAVMRDSSHTDIRQVLPVVRAPTLVLHRTDDQIESIDSGRYVARNMPNARLVELPGGDGIPWLGDPAGVLREIRRFVDDPGTEESPSDDRRLATVLFTDVVDSTAAGARLGDRAWGDLLERHHALVRGLLTRYRGVEVDTAGDGFFATFDGPGRAVRCACDIVAAVQALGIEVRAGVHTGEVQTIAGKAGGIAVVVGARIGALAGPSEVWASQTVKDLTAGSGLAYDERGERELKGVPDQWRVYRVTA